MVHVLVMSTCCVEAFDIMSTSFVFRLTILDMLACLLFVAPGFGVYFLLSLLLLHLFLFFFNDTATTEIYTLSLHDALPIFRNKETRHRMFIGLLNTTRKLA